MVPALLVLLLSLTLQAPVGDDPAQASPSRWTVEGLPALPADLAERDGLPALLAGEPLWIEAGNPADDVGGGARPGRCWRPDRSAGSWRPAGELPGLHPGALTVVDGDGLLLLDGPRTDGGPTRLWRLSDQGVGVETASVGGEGPPAPTAGAAAVRVGRTLIVLGVGDDPARAGVALELEGLVLVGRRPVPALPSGPREGAALAVRAVEGAPHLIVCGGALADGTVSDEVWALDPVGLTWRALAPLPAPRTGAGAWPLGPAHLALVGGRGEAGDGRPVPALAWHAVTGAWTTWDDLPVVGPDERVLAAGDGLLVWPAAPRATALSGAPSPSPSPRLLGHAPAPQPLADLDLAVLVGYLALLLVIGALFARRARTRGDYFLAGRRIPWWAAGLSLYGTQLSAITFMTTPALAFATDLRYAPTWLAVLAIAPVVGRLYIPVLRRLDVTTAYEFLEQRFSPLVRRVGSAAFLVYQLARMAIVVYLPSLAVAALTGLDTATAIALTGLMATAYTVLGGLEAVVWTDVLQVLVLMGGVVVALALGLSDVGGLDGLVERAGPAGKLRLWDGGFALTEEASWSLLIGAFFLQFGPYVTDQAFVQRYLATPDEASARRGLLLNGWLSLPAALIFPTLGVVLWAWFGAHPEAMEPGMRHDAVVPVFLAARLPAGLAGLMIAGLFAATMSSLDSAMHSVATTISHDWRRAGHAEPDSTGGARGLTVAAGLAGTGAALALGTLHIPLLFLFFSKAVGLLASGTAAMFLLGLSTRRVGSRGALLAALASTAAVAWAAFASDLHSFWYGALGLVAGCAAGWASSVLRPEQERP